MPSSQKVLIVDDEIAIADALRHQLQREHFAVEHAPSAERALKLLRELSDIALVILDVGLPDTLGTTFFHTIRSLHAELPIVFLTARSDEIDKIVGLELGADDYITKPFSPREVVARVKNILKRAAATRTNLDQPLTTQPPAEFIIDNEQKKILFKGCPLELSRYEFLLIKLLLTRPGKVFSREEILARVWESPEMSLERTVDTHIKTLRAKLRAIDAQQEYIVTHRGFGYSIEGLA